MSINDILEYDISFNKNKLNDLKKKEIFSSLAIMLQTGINLKDSLEIISKDLTTDKNSIIILVEITNHIKKGFAFSQAMSTTNVFNKYEIFNVKIGEETGKLSQTMINLSEYISKNIELKRKVKSAFSYPIIVLSTAIIAVIFMLNFVVPMFEDIFKRFGHELPYLTQLIIKLSKNIKWILPLIFIITLSIYFLDRTFSKNVSYLRSKTFAILKIPVVGNLIRTINLARFTSAFELFISSDITVHRSISLIKEMSTFYPLVSSLQEIEKRLIKGENFYEAINSQPFFDKKLVAMVKVGMETNKLEDVFKMSKESYYEEISYKTSILNSIIEPIMIIFIGLIVAVILVSMYLPIFKLSMSFEI